MIFIVLQTRGTLTTNNVQLAGELAAVPEHGVLFEQLGIAGTMVPASHKLCKEEGDAACSCDHCCLPDKAHSQEEGAV